MAKGFCPKCGRMRSSRTGSCSVCGTLLRPEDPAPAPHQPRIAWLIIPIAILVAAGFLIAFRAGGRAGTPTATIAPTSRATSAASLVSTTTPSRTPPSPTVPPTTALTIEPSVVPSQAPSATPEPPPPTATPQPVPPATPVPTKRPVPTNPPSRSYVARVNRNYGHGGAHNQRASCIIGRVSANGRGIGGAVLYANNGLASTGTVTTNDNGDYSICRLGESRWSIVLTFVPRADAPSKSRINGQVVAVVTLNGNPEQIASVDFIER